MIIYIYIHSCVYPHWKQVAFTFLLQVRGKAKVSEMGHHRMFWKLAKLHNYTHNHPPHSQHSTPGNYHANQPNFRILSGK